MNVSFTQSTVHVPFNVYARKTAVIHGAVISEGLDRTFNENLGGEGKSGGRTFSWQYFAGADGFTRFFPGLQWKLDDEIGRPIDYDARFEPWYISSVNYPKEIVILLDSSGSMKGFRQILAILTIRQASKICSQIQFFRVRNLFRVRIFRAIKMFSVEKV